MLSINLETNLLRVAVPQKLKAGDFQHIAPQVDTIIQQYGEIRLLVDATQFDGWENLEAFEKHLNFIKDHQGKIEKIAILAGHAWHHWLAGMARIFVHPDVKVFEAGEEVEAKAWLDQRVNKQPIAA